MDGGRSGAGLAKVSVRTLHHYDEIGLLARRPQRRGVPALRGGTSSGCTRSCSSASWASRCERSAGSCSTRPSTAPRRSRAALPPRREGARTEAMLDAIDAALAATEKGTTMSDQERAEMFGELFDGFNPDDYEDEVQERWGETDAYKQICRAHQALHQGRLGADQGRERGEHRRVRRLHGRRRARRLARSHRRRGGTARTWRNGSTTARSRCTRTRPVWVNDPFTKNIDKAREGLAAYQSAAAGLGGHARSVPGRRVARGGPARLTRGCVPGGSRPHLSARRV